MYRAGPGNRTNDRHGLGNNQLSGLSAHAGGCHPRPPIVPRGIMAVPDKRFADTLREEIGPWLAAGERHVLLSGMIGSRQGWVEAPYIPCPAGAADIAARADRDPVRLGAGAPRAWPLRADAAGVPEVMRGEETQLAGVLARLATAPAGRACRGRIRNGRGRVRPHHPLHHAPDRRGVRGAARPHNPRPHDARWRDRAGRLRCRSPAVRRSGRLAAPPVRRACARADRSAVGSGRRVLSVGRADRP